MNYYTAKQVSEILQQDDPKMNLRTVRYYTQIGMVPPLELIGNKRVYSQRHIHFFRAIITLTRTGESLAFIQEKLKSLPIEEVEKIGQQIHLHDPIRVLENETFTLTEDVAITLSPRISADLKQKVIESVSHILREDKNNV